MTCNCICKCQNQADATGPVPTMCTDCTIYNGLNDPAHQLPYVSPVEEKLVPLEPITNAQKDKAIQNFVAENGF